MSRNTRTTLRGVGLVVGLLVVTGAQAADVVTCTAAQLREPGGCPVTSEGSATGTVVTGGARPWLAGIRNDLLALTPGLGPDLTFEGQPLDVRFDRGPLLVRQDADAVTARVCTW